jgi:hypothetical protein
MLGVLTLVCHNQRDTDIFRDHRQRSSVVSATAYISTGGQDYSTRISNCGVPLGVPSLAFRWATQCIHTACAYHLLHRRRPRKSLRSSTSATTFSVTLSSAQLSEARHSSEQPNLQPSPFFGLSSCGGDFYYMEAGQFSSYPLSTFNAPPQLSQHTPLHSKPLI